MPTKLFTHGSVSKLCTVKSSNKLALKLFCPCGGQVGALCWAARSASSAGSIPGTVHVSSAACAIGCQTPVAARCLTRGLSPSTTGSICGPTRPPGLMALLVLPFAGTAWAPGVAPCCRVMHSKPCVVVEAALDAGTRLSAGAAPGAALGVRSTVLNGTNSPELGPTPVAGLTYTLEMAINGRGRGALLGPAVGSCRQKNGLPAGATSNVK